MRQNLPAQVVFPARWVYNPANQGLYASNEAAYFLMGNSEDAVAAAAKKAPVEVPPARLPKAPEPAPAPLTSSESADERKLKELLERARSVRPAQVEEPEVFVHREPAEPAAPAAPAASTPVAPAAPAAPEPTAETTVETTDPLAVDSEAPVESVPVESFALPAPVEDAPAAEVAEAPVAEAQAEDAPVAEAQAEPASAAKSSSKKQRVSVPAWDDIIFGGRK